MNSARDQRSLIGGMLAFAVGDALGWPVEGRGNRVGGITQLKPELKFMPWLRREGGRYAPREEPVPAGTYSDDTQLMLAVARSLRHEDWWGHLTRTELPWWHHYQLGGGGATLRATSSWARGKPPWVAANPKRYWQAGGNGAAMRVFAHAVEDSFDLARDRVLADGAATHGHPVGLVSSQAYAYALWVSIRRREPLAWGQLLDEVLNAVPQWAQLNPHGVPEEWGAALPDDYEEQWSRAVEEFLALLQLARNQMSYGALNLDDRILEELGAFSRQNGAGTVTVASALYLASRHASDPRQGLLRAAFAKGADTDTLAAMTAALLGAVHGSDWLGDLGELVTDADLLRRTALSLGDGALAPAPSYRRPEQRNVESALARARPGEHLSLPFYGEVEIRDIHDLDNNTSWIRSWWMHNQEGQTFRITRNSKAKPTPPWIQLELADRTDAPDPSTTTPKAPPAPPPPTRMRSGLVVVVRDLERSKHFYASVLGMAVTRITRYGVTLNTWLALESAQDPQSLVASQTPPARLAVTVYTDVDSLKTAENRMREAKVTFTTERGERGVTVRTTDPDGMPVEIRAN